MKKLILLSLICLSLQGCIPLLVGGLVGYEIAKDRDQNNINPRTTQIAEEDKKQ